MTHSIPIDARKLTGGAVGELAWEVSGYPAATWNPNAIQLGGLAEGLIAAGTLAQDGTGTVTLPDTEEGQYFELRFPDYPGRSWRFDTQDGSTGDLAERVEAWAIAHPEGAPNIVHVPTPGEEGRGIASVSYVDPNLTITLTDGTVIGPFDIKGADGIGSFWFEGSGPPTSSDPPGPSDHDFYLDADNNIVYEIDGTAWNRIASLGGDKGEPGRRGSVWY